MIINQVTPPTVEPVTVQEAKDHMRVTHNDDNTYIGGLIVAARQHAESYTRRCFVQSTWDEWFQCFPIHYSFKLSKAPLVSVTGVYYTDYEETETEMTVTTDYLVDADTIPGHIVLAYGQAWPTFTPSVKAPVRVRYIAGYPSDGSPADYRANIPKTIKQALLLLVSHWYNQREDGVYGFGLQEIPHGAKALLTPDRIFTL